MRLASNPLSFHRRSTIITGIFLLLWLGAWVIVLVQRVDGGSSWLLQPGAGGVAPLGWMGFAAYPLAVWLFVDLFLVRRAPPEFRKAQWGSTGLMLLLLILLATVLESLTTALQHANSGS